MYNQTVASTGIKMDCEGFEENNWRLDIKVYRRFDICKPTPFIILKKFKSFQELGVEITFAESLVLHQLKVKWNGCFYPFNYILA